ncbi:hypothetical protein ACFL6C_02045 [Myxococcota bacterium]
MSDIRATTVTLRIGDSIWTALDRLGFDDSVLSSQPQVLAWVAHHNKIDNFRADKNVQAERSVVLPTRASFDAVVEEVNNDLYRYEHAFRIVRKDLVTTAAQAGLAVPVAGGLSGRDLPGPSLQSALAVARRAASQGDLARLERALVRVEALGSPDDPELAQSMGELRAACSMRFYLRGRKGWPATSAAAVKLKAEGASWSNAEIRQYYLDINAEIGPFDQHWIRSGLSPEARARAAYSVRHNARIMARAMMASRQEVELLRQRDQAKYGNPDGPTFQQLIEKFLGRGSTHDEACIKIVGSAQRTNKKVNDKFGLKSRPAQSPQPVVESRQ